MRSVTKNIILGAAFIFSTAAQAGTVDEIKKLECGDYQEKQQPYFLLDSQGDKYVEGRMAADLAAMSNAVNPVEGRDVRPIYDYPEEGLVAVGALVAGGSTWGNMSVLFEAVQAQNLTETKSLKLFFTNPMGQRRMAVVNCNITF